MTMMMTFNYGGLLFMVTGGVLVQATMKSFECWNIKLSGMYLCLNWIDKWSGNNRVQRGTPWLYILSGVVKLVGSSRRSLLAQTVYVGTSGSDAGLHITSFCERRAVLSVSVCVDAGQHGQGSPFLRFLNLVCRQVAGLLEQRIGGPHLTPQ